MKLFNYRLYNVIKLDYIIKMLKVFVHTNNILTKEHCDEVYYNL